jgi:hypothetical protein
MPVRLLRRAAVTSKFFGPHGRNFIIYDETVVSG